MAIDPARPRTRRSLLAASLGGVAAALATAMGRPSVVRAADGDPIVIGEANAGTSKTALTQSTAGQPALEVVGADQSAALVVGNPNHIAIYGTSTSGSAIAGHATNGIGLHGSSDSDYGVRGSTSLAGGTGVGGMAPVHRTGVYGYSGDGLPETPTVSAGVYGQAQEGTGVRGDSGAYVGLAGYSGPPAAVIPGIAADIGVYGYSNVGSASAGVHGRSHAGRGVQGTSATGSGVLGRSDSAIGVHGVSTSGAGVRGTSSTGPAVQAIGGSGSAILATNSSTTAATIVAQSSGRAAVHAFTGSSAIDAPRENTGIQGECDKGTTAIGVLGQSIQGAGVLGRSGEGTGVAGESGYGSAVVGDSTEGYGVVGVGYNGVWGTGAAGVVGDVDGGTGVMGWTGTAFAPGPVARVGVWAGAQDGRTALQVQGVTRMNRSGRVNFTSGQASRKVTVSGGITAGSFGIAMLQASRSGVWVRAVVPSSSDSSITIYLSKAVTSTTSVGWVVLG